MPKNGRTIAVNWGVQMSCENKHGAGFTYGDVKVLSN